MAEPRVSRLKRAGGAENSASSRNMNSIAARARAPPLPRARSMSMQRRVGLYPRSAPIGVPRAPARLILCSAPLPPPLPSRARAVAADAADAAPSSAPPPANFDAARLLSGDALYTPPPLVVGPVAPDLDTSGSKTGLRLVVTQPVRAGDFLLGCRALAAAYGPGAAREAGAAAAASAAPSNADLVDALGWRDYTADELEWLELLAAGGGRRKRRREAEGEEEEDEEDEDDEEHNDDEQQQEQRLEQARRLFSRAADAPPSSSSPTGAPCPLTPAELEQLVARTALAEPCEDAAAAALRAAAAAAAAPSSASAAAVATAASAASVTALWPAFALANHSCAPSASAAVFGPYLVLRAAQGMLPGDEVSVCYLGDERFAPVARRRSLLRRRHGFLCQCRRCLAEQRVFPTRYYPQDDVLLGLADDPLGDEEGRAEGGEQEAPDGDRPRLARNSLPSRALGWVAALATGRGLAAAARAWRGGRPPLPRPAPDHRCLEETWALASGPLAEDVRAARPATVRGAGRRADAARRADTARARLDAALAWAGSNAVARRPRALLGGGEGLVVAEGEVEKGEGKGTAAAVDAAAADDSTVPFEAAGWFAACGMPLHRLDAELSSLMASAAVVAAADDGSAEEDDEGEGGGGGGTRREVQTPWDDELRARRGLRSLTAAQRRRLSALGRCLSAAEAVARGSDLHCALAVEYASVARTVAARAAAQAAAAAVEEEEGRGRAAATAAATASKAALAADLRCARAHRERYGGPNECPPELIARLLAARRRAVTGAALAERIGVIAWGEALTRDRFAPAAASAEQRRRRRLGNGGSGGGGNEDETQQDLRRMLDEGGGGRGR